MRSHIGELFELDDDPDRVDVERLFAFLSREVYWSTWRTRSDLEHQLARAWRVVGLYERTMGTMVGFARALSDGVAVAYLADVYVEPFHRGQGLGLALLRAMVDTGPGSDFRWMLHTADAHGLYRKLGFREPDGEYLERPPRKR